MDGVLIKDLVESMNLINYLPEIDLRGRKVFQSDVNRPALQLTGFFDYFDSERVQIIGKVEDAYIEGFSDERKEEIFSQLFSFDIPCLIFSRTILPDDIVLECGRKYNVPIFGTHLSTTYFNSELTRKLRYDLAPVISIHGVLVDVYGEGVLIRGESGIGKSEVAIELIKRGHRLVADDVVEIKKISEDVLIGRAPEIIRHFIEVRGVGIVDIKTLFGVESVKESQKINLIINLAEWSKTVEYDRLGLTEEYDEILGTKIVSHTIPVRPGRNLAIIVESAAVNHRQKAMGYNAAVELNRRVEEKIIKENKDV